MRRTYFLFGLSACIAVFLVWVYLPVLTKYRELRTQEDRMSHEIAVLDDKIMGLEQERDLLKSDVSYIEKVIRDELGYVRPGETVLKFVQDPKKSGEAASASNAANPVPPAGGPSSPETAAYDSSSLPEPASNPQ